MNLGELQSELFELLGRRGTDQIATTRYYLWLNNTEVEIASAFQFFQTEKVVTSIMAVAQRRYQLPSDCLAIYDLRDTTIKRKIKRAGFRYFDNTDYTATGDPTRYVRYGNYFEFNLTPDSANGLQLRYCGTLTSMSATTDVPTLPKSWHEAILLGGEYRGWRALGEIKKALLVKNEYLAMVRSRNSEWEIEDGDEEFGVEMVR